MYRIGEEIWECVRSSVFLFFAPRSLQAEKSETLGRAVLAFLRGLPNLLGGLPDERAATGRPVPEKCGAEGEATREVIWWDRTRAECITMTITITGVVRCCVLNTRGWGRQRRYATQDESD